MNIKQELPSIEVETNRSSTFNMISKMYGCRRSINSTINCVVELSGISISERALRKANSVCSSLERAAQVTETQSASSYITLSTTSKLIQILFKKFKAAIEDNDTIYVQIITAMLKKLGRYAEIIDWLTFFKTIQNIGSPIRKRHSSLFGFIAQICFRSSIARKYQQYG